MFESNIYNFNVHIRDVNMYPWVRIVWYPSSLR